MSPASSSSGNEVLCTGKWLLPEKERNSCKYNQSHNYIQTISKKSNCSSSLHIQPKLGIGKLISDINGVLLHYYIIIIIINEIYIAQVCMSQRN